MLSTCQGCRLFSPVSIYNLFVMYILFPFSRLRNWTSRILVICLMSHRDTARILTQLNSKILFYLYYIKFLLPQIIKQYLTNNSPYSQKIFILLTCFNIHHNVPLKFSAKELLHRLSQSTEQWLGLNYLKNNTYIPQRFWE